MNFLRILEQLQIEKNVVNINEIPSLFFHDYEGAENAFFIVRVNHQFLSFRHTHAARQRLHSHYSTDLSFAHLVRSMTINSRKFSVPRTKTTDETTRDGCTVSLSFLTSRWRFDLPGGSDLQYSLIARETNAMMIYTRLSFSSVGVRARGSTLCIHPRRSRDLIPGTHLLDWGRTNFSISRQLRGCERVEHQRRPSPVTCIGISHRIHTSGYTVIYCCGQNIAGVFKSFVSVIHRDF